MIFLPCFQAQVFITCRWKFRSPIESYIIIRDGNVGSIKSGLRMFQYNNVAVVSLCIHLAYYQFVVTFKPIILFQLVYDTLHVSIKRSRLMGHGI